MGRDITGITGVLARMRSGENRQLVITGKSGAERYGFYQLLIFEFRYPNDNNFKCSEFFGMHSTE